MQVSFERSGGFTGVLITLSLDTATLSPDQVTQLQRLVDEADFFHLPAAIPAAQPDRFQYRITIQEGDREHTVTVGEPGVPNTLRPLLEWLMEAARNQR
jgi:hypothetical protein